MEIKCDSDLQSVIRACSTLCRQICEHSETPPFELSVWIYRENPKEWIVSSFEPNCAAWKILVRSECENADYTVIFAQIRMHILRRAKKERTI